MLCCVAKKFTTKIFNGLILIATSNKQDSHKKSKFSNLFIFNIQTKMEAIKNNI